MEPAVLGGGGRNVEMVGLRVGYVDGSVVGSRVGLRVGLRVEGRVEKCFCVEEKTNLN